MDKISTSDCWKYFTMIRMDKDGNKEKITIVAIEYMLLVEENMVFLI